MEKLHPLFYIGPIGFTLSIVIQWIIMALISIAAVVLTRNLKKVPDGKQTVLEMFVNLVSGLVKENMGESYSAFVPYVGTLMLYMLMMNLVGLVGFKPPTTDYSVALGMALVTFFAVQSYAIKKVGLLHYFGGYASPYAFLLPINIMERVLLPVSLSLRLFGNMTAATVIIDLVYSKLSLLSGFAQLAIPIPLHLYFDVFDGTIQMVIFAMLTMINIKIISEH